MKLFMKSSIFIVCLVFSAFGQNTSEKVDSCTNQTVESIASRGINLGMTQEEILNLFVENGKLNAVSSEYLQNEGRNRITMSKVEYQNIANSLKNRAGQMYGFSAISLAPKDKSKFDGISYYDLGFLDNSLAFFRVYYLKPKWESREQFVRKLSEILNLPMQRYLEGNPYLLKCGDYTIDFTENFNNEVRYSMLVSADVDKIIRERRKKAEDEQREKDIKTFKP